MDLMTILFSGFALASGIGILMERPSRRLSFKVPSRQKLNPSLSKFQRKDDTSLLMELPDFTSVLWFLLSAGHNLEQALRITVSRSRGQVAEVFAEVIRNVDFGGLIQQELENLASQSKDLMIQELATKLSMASRNGSLLSEQLGEYVISVSQQLRSVLLDKAQKSEPKMMIPLVFVILPVTVVFALYPSVVIIQQSFA